MIFAAMNLSQTLDILPYLLNASRKFEFSISQGGVATVRAKCQVNVAWVARTTASATTTTATTNIFLRL